jgi:hypothetical protein
MRIYFVYFFSCCLYYYTHGATSWSQVLESKALCPHRIWPPQPSTACPAWARGRAEEQVLQTLGCGCSNSPLQRRSLQPLQPLPRQLLHVCASAAQMSVHIDKPHKGGCCFSVSRRCYVWRRTCTSGLATHFVPSPTSTCPIPLMGGFDRGASDVLTSFIVYVYSGS